MTKLMSKYFSGKGGLKKLVRLILEPTSNTNPEEIKFQKEIASLTDEEFVGSLYGVLAILPEMRQAVIDNTPGVLAEFTVPVVDKMIEALARDLNMPEYANLVLTSELTPRLQNKQRGGGPAQANASQQLVAGLAQGAARSALSERVADLIDAAADVKQLQLREAKRVVMNDLNMLHGTAETMLVGAITACLQVIIFFFVYFAAGVAGGIGTIVLLVTFWLISGAAAAASAFSIPGIISGIISMIIALSGGVVSGAVGGVANGVKGLFTMAAGAFGAGNKNKNARPPTQQELNEMARNMAITAEKRRHAAVKQWIDGLATHIANVKEEWHYLLEQFIELPKITMAHQVAVGFICYIVLFVTVQRIRQMYVDAKRTRSNERVRELMGNANALLEASVRQQLQAPPQILMLQQPAAAAQPLLLAAPPAAAPAAAQPLLLGAPPAAAQPLLLGAPPAAAPAAAAPPAAAPANAAAAAPAGGRRRNKKTRSKKSHKRRMTKRR